MQTTEAAQMTRFTDKFNSLLSSLKNASGLPQKRQKMTDQNSVGGACGNNLSSALQEKVA